MLLSPFCIGKTQHRLVKYLPSFTQLVSKRLGSWIWAKCKIPCCLSESWISLLGQCSDWSKWITVWRTNSFVVLMWVTCGLVQAGESGVAGRVVLLQEIVARELSRRDLDRPGQRLHCGMSQQSWDKTFCTECLWRWEDKLQWWQLQTGRQLISFQPGKERLAHFSFIFDKPSWLWDDGWGTWGDGKRRKHKSMIINLCQSVRWGLKSILIWFELYINIMVTKRCITLL